MKIVLATGNTGKRREIQALLEPLSIEVVAQSELAVPDAIENGLSFIENAIIKARNAAIHTGLPALADDSGLEVDALHGAPGIHSARYAGTHGDDAANNAKLLQELAGVDGDNRSARFHCAMAYVRHAKDPAPIICEGSWEGVILTKADGDNGFGYDPLFFVPEQNCSSARLPPAEKNKHSHRGKALSAMLDKLRCI